MSKIINKVVIYIYNIKLTTSEDIPFMWRKKCVCITDKYFKIIHYTTYLKNKEVENVLRKLEEKYLVKLLHTYYSLPKDINRLVSYDVDMGPTKKNFKVIDYTND